MSDPKVFIDDLARENVIQNRGFNVETSESPLSFRLVRTIQKIEVSPFIATKGNTKIAI